MFDFEPFTGFLQQRLHKKGIAGIIFDQKDTKPVFGHKAWPIRFSILAGTSDTNGSTGLITLILHIFSLTSNPAHQSATAP